MLNRACKVIDNCKIYGNGHYKELIYGWQLTDVEKKDFDYLDNIEDDFTGFRYKNNVYSLDQFMRTEKHSPFYGFCDGSLNDTYFSGILVKFSDDNEAVKVYTFYS